MFEVWKSVTERARTTRFCATAVWRCLDTPIDIHDGSIALYSLMDSTVIKITAKWLLMKQRGQVLPIDQLLLSPAGRRLDASAEKPPLQRWHSMALIGLAQLCSWYVCNSEGDSGGPTHARTSFSSHRDIAYCSCSSFSLAFSLTLSPIFTLRTLLSITWTLVLRCGR